MLKMGSNLSSEEHIHKTSKSNLDIQIGNKYKYQKRTFETEDRTKNKYKKTTKTIIESKKKKNIHNEAKRRTKKTINDSEEHIEVMRKIQQKKHKKLLQ
jgi:hypothetical protein